MFDQYIRRKHGVIRAKQTFFWICHAVGGNCYFGFTILVRLNLILAEYKTCKLEILTNLSISIHSLADLDVCQTSRPARAIEYALAIQ